MLSKAKEWFLKNVSRDKNKPRLLNQLIWFMGRPYLAGSSLEEGLKNIESSDSYSTLDILGEAAQTKEDADRFIETYIDAIDNLAEKYPDGSPSSISVKLSAICEPDKPGEIPPIETMEQRLEEIVSYSKDNGIDVTLDMESHEWTDITLAIVRNLWNKGYDNLGTVLQAKLNRTERDIVNLFQNNYTIDKKKIRIRACLGAYLEDESIATKNNKEAKRRLAARIKQLFEAGAYVEIATHDHSVIHEVIDYIDEHQIDNDRFEFQFLRGVDNGTRIEPTLKERGYKVRYYMPIEIEKFDGVPYIIRRIMENPDFAINYAKNLGQKVINPALDLFRGLKKKLTYKNKPTIQ